MIAQKTRCQCVPGIVEGTVQSECTIGNTGGEHQLTVTERQVQKNAAHIPGSETGVHRGKGLFRIGGREQKDKFHVQRGVLSADQFIADRAEMRKGKILTAPGGELRQLFCIKKFPVDMPVHTVRDGTVDRRFRQQEMVKQLTF